GRGPGEPHLVDPPHALDRTEARRHLRLVARPLLEPRMDRRRARVGSPARLRRHRAEGSLRRWARASSSCTSTAWAPTCSSGRSGLIGCLTLAGWSSRRVTPFTATG